MVVMVVLLTIFVVLVFKIVMLGVLTITLVEKNDSGGDDSSTASATAGLATFRRLSSRPGASLHCLLPCGQDVVLTGCSLWARHCFNWL